MTNLWKGSWILFLAAALVLGLSACSDDDDDTGGGDDIRPPGQTQGPGGTVDLPGDSATTIPGQSTATTIPGLTGTGASFDCSQIPAGQNLGNVCQDPAACGEGGACVSAEAGAEANCVQLCSPGVCTDVCNAGEQCVQLTDQGTGEPLEFAPGVPVGGCVEPPEGQQGAFEACGTADTGACQAGSQCAGVDQSATVGTCIPSCTQAAPTCPQPHAGFTAECALSFEGGGDAMGCGYPCTAGDNTTCPDGMNCISLGQGAVCAR